MASKVEVIQQLVEPVIVALGYQLWGIEYLGQGRHTLLRIFIDKMGGINVDDCAEVSRQVSSILDVEDPIKDEYTLEVSSPGLDRILFRPEHYQQNIGATVKVRLQQNVNGRRNYVGLLQAIEQIGQEVRQEQVQAWEIVVIVDNETFRLPVSMIEKAHLVSQ
jgi:ribosome maturation factor RimP